MCDGWIGPLSPAAVIRARALSIRSPTNIFATPESTIAPRSVELPRMSCIICRIVSVGILERRQCS